MPFPTSYLPLALAHARNSRVKKGHHNQSSERWRGGGLLLLLDIDPFNWYYVRVKRVGSARPQVKYHNWVKKITVYINTLISKFCMLCLYRTMMHTRVFNSFHLCA